MPRRKLADELRLRAAIEADLRAGQLSLYAIAHAHGVSWATVRNYRSLLPAPVELAAPTAETPVPSSTPPLTSRAYGLGELVEHDHTRWVVKYVYPDGKLKLYSQLRQRYADRVDPSLVTSL